MVFSGHPEDRQSHTKSLSVFSSVQNAMNAVDAIENADLKWKGTAAAVHELKRVK